MPYGDCEADTNSGDAPPELTCVETTDDDDLTCAGYVEGESMGTCVGTAKKGEKCRDSSFTGSKHKAMYVCKDGFKCKGYVDGKKWGECKKKS